MSSVEPRPKPKEDRPTVLEVRDGLVRVWRLDWRIPWPWELRADDETRDMVKSVRSGWTEDVLGLPGLIRGRGSGQEDQRSNEDVLRPRMS